MPGMNLKGEAGERLFINLKMKKTLKGIGRKKDQRGCGEFF
jgi:hypothetical protein